MVLPMTRICSRTLTWLTLIRSMQSKIKIMMTRHLRKLLTQITLITSSRLKV